MSTRTAIADGYMSNTATWGAAAPVAGDSIVLAGFKVVADYSLALASVTSTTGSTLIPASGNVQLTITAFTTTNPIIIQGSPGATEMTSIGNYVNKGTGGI